MLFLKGSYDGRGERRRGVHHRGRRKFIEKHLLLPSCFINTPCFFQTPSNGLSAKIDGLRPGHLYQFEVYAINKEGLSLPIRTKDPIKAENPYSEQIYVNNRIYCLKRFFFSFCYSYNRLYSQAAAVATTTTHSFVVMLLLLFPACGPAVIAATTIAH